MRVYLIRHTAPEVAGNLCYGQADIAPGPDFEREKCAVAAKIDAVAALDRIYSSPLKRCTQLAHALHAAHPVVDNRLLEMNFGDWELMPWEQIDRQALDMWARDFVIRKPPGGENLQIVFDRTRSFIRHLHEQGDECVAVVTHAGVIRCFWSYILQVPLHNVFRIKVGHGDVFLVELAENIEYTSITKL